ncbi:RNA 2',3'-cyclic phosphodiesterase [Geothrix terrae]|uniref:RNA 2',3'-cyclic phosphodiesterase n=1 Tax=Geothrix terrae TaxID=2922720 RepID=UPI001FABE263|nr:RNA 2',3'-cyclic phosphodiesterase [Geothrix terrae]
MAESSLRLFFALPLPSALQASLGRWQAAHPGIDRWSRPEGLHLTLAFLGERPPEGLSALQALGAGVAGCHRAFPLATAGLGTFPTGPRARVLWLALAPSPILEALAADLRGALAAAGEAFDAKPFRAHLTLARLRRPQPLGAFDAPPPATFTADRLVLFESGPQGSYTPLRAWNLRTV